MAPENQNLITVLSAGGRPPRFRVSWQRSWRRRRIGNLGDFPADNNKSYPDSPRRSFIEGPRPVPTFPCPDPGRNVLYPGVSLSLDETQKWFSLDQCGQGRPPPPLRTHRQIDPDPGDLRAAGWSLAPAPACLDLGSTPRFQDGVKVLARRFCRWFRLAAPVKPIIRPESVRPVHRSSRRNPKNGKSAKSFAADWATMGSRSAKGYRETNL